ncbi:hypothetical protein QBZ16_004702 [Prototheca wickerhamii]|uniref:START domain-containing protein n=1 Tax=Prototheca wickerhamii TaxID=3111 RepID=A0AAD9MGJ9_PROWI|nr:hypothetical protein QBZ16_004702 [Prototheca wickerhamii]
MTQTGATPKRGHARSRSGVSDGESPILQGWLARESGIVNQLLNRRYGALYPSSLVTYRKETDDSPSKVWPLSSDVALTPVTASHFKLRHAKTSTLWAVTAKAYDSVEMWTFTIRWPNSGVIGQDHLVLAPVGAAPAAPRAGRRAAGAGDDAPRARARSWASVLHINGIAVFVEEADAADSGGAIMVSAVVRGAPQDVFRGLVSSRRSEGPHVFSGARVVEAIDGSTQVVAQTFRASGPLGAVLAPREMVLLRTWRRDEDGTFIVLYQSTQHRSVPEKRGWGPRTPVRLAVQAAGFTIAPLLPRFRQPGGESRECLLTMVIKADLGGALAQAARAFNPLLMYRRQEEPLLLAQRAAAAQRLSKLAGTGTAAGGLEPVKEADEREAPAPAAEDSQAVSAVSDDHAGAGASDAWAIPGTCPRKYWSSPDDAGFKVRGPTYLADRKKIPAGGPLFELVAVDLIELEEPMLHVCRHLPSVRASPAPFLFCVQMMVPCKPPVGMVASWASPVPVQGVPEEQLLDSFRQYHGGELSAGETAFLRALASFLEGDAADDDARRNRQFKMIPHISKGPWIMQKSVGTTPVILGQKLRTKYFRGEKYFEVDVDIGASSVAASITNMVIGATKSLTLDMAVLIEGQSPEHLPEQLLGIIRLANLDMKSAAYYDEAAGKLIPADQVGK